LSTIERGKKHEPSVALVAVLSDRFRRTRRTTDHGAGAPIGHEIGLSVSTKIQSPCAANIIDSQEVVVERFDDPIEMGGTCP
jgi:hypothetical protein